MSWAEERQILESYFDKQWRQAAAPNNFATVSVQYEGQIYDTPTTGAEFISMWVIGTDQGTQIELGTPALERYVGIIQFTINVPIGRGGGPNARARQIGDAISALFKKRRFQMTGGGWIRCRIPGLKMVGEQADQRFVSVLSIPYLRDEFSAAPAPVLLPSTPIATSVADSNAANWSDETALS